MTLKVKLHKSLSSQLARVNPGSVAWSTYYCYQLPSPPDPLASGRDDSPSQGDLQHYVAVTHLYTWVKRDGEAKIPHYSNDTTTNFIPEQLHFISTYFSVFVYLNDILFLTSHSGSSSFWFSIQVKFSFWYWTLFRKHECWKQLHPKLKNADYM